MRKLSVFLALALLTTAACGGGGNGNSNPAGNIAELAKNAGPITPEGEKIASGTLTSIQNTSSGSSSASGVGPSKSLYKGLYKESYSWCDGHMTVETSDEGVNIHYNDLDLGDCIDEDILTGAIINGNMSIHTSNHTTTVTGDMTADYNNTPVEITREDSTIANCTLNGASDINIDGTINFDDEYELISMNFLFHTTGDVDLSGDIEANVVYDVEIINTGTDEDTSHMTCAGQMIITRSGGSAEFCNVSDDCTGCL